jgi:ribosomal protein S18 acetylase RimI-like enzyme
MMHMTPVPAYRLIKAWLFYMQHTMNIHSRPLDLPNELLPALALADASPLAIPHIADWPYRFSSWALDDPRNMQGWFNGSRLMGWAVMQTPFWAIDCVLHPEAPAQLYSTMLEWAKMRAGEMNAQGEGRPMWFLSIDARCETRRRVLERLDFVDVAEDGADAWSKVLFELSEVSATVMTPLPAGLHIRSLNPSTEIQAYVDLHREVFGSENMTAGWRAQSTRTASYINDLDLVVASEAGELHGFCVAWLRKCATGETVGQIEPLGVRESRRGQRLSQALMAEAIRRLRAHGATRIFVETDRQREAAMAAYASIGFKIAYDVQVYRYMV